MVSPKHDTDYIYREIIRKKSRLANSSVDNNLLFCMVTIKCTKYSLEDGHTAPATTSIPYVVSL